jgi:molecular chaperone DnaK (HSP70)
MSTAGFPSIETRQAEVCIGIDFGFSNVRAAIAREGASPQVILTKEKKRLTPAVVARHHRDGTLVVGDQAICIAPADPINAIFSIKSLIGRCYGDPEVEKIKKQVSYRIVCPDGARGQAYVMLGEKSYSPIEISALILEKIKSDAEAALGHPVTHAVITVPAYFHDLQHYAAYQAACLAGFKVKRKIAEPTAVAYAYGLTRDASTTKTIIVYDLGGTGFDVSILSIAEGIPLLDHIEGDTWLGGDRFDNMIMDYVISQVESRNRGIERELRVDPEFMWKLKLESEEAKKALGGSPSTDIVMYGMLKGKIDVDVQLKAADFESWIRKDIAGTIALMEKAMAGSGLTSEDIDNVLLVSGSTALPLVRRLLIERFGEDKIRTDVNPAECVALGAAIIAGALMDGRKTCIARDCRFENEQNANRCSACGRDISDVDPLVKCCRCGDMHQRRDEVFCPTRGFSGPKFFTSGKPYGIEIEGGKFEIIVPKNTRWLIHEPIFREFRTEVDGQEQIVIGVYQGYDEIASKNEKQAEIIVPEAGLIPEDKRVPKGTPYDIGLEIDENGTVQIVVRGKGALEWLNFCKLLRPWDLGPPRPKNGEA